MKSLIIITCLVINLPLYGQNDLNANLLALEEDYFATKNEKEKTGLILKKIDCYLHYKNYSYEVINEAKRINDQLITDSTCKANFYWNMALVGLMNKEQIFADQMLFKHELFTHKTSIETKFLSLQINRTIDSVEFATKLIELSNEDSLFSCLSCLQLLGTQQEFSESKMVRYSKVIPGLGTIKSGDTRSGLFSIVTHLGTITGSALLFRYGLYFNSITWAGSLLPRFYSGNIALTKKQVAKRNAIAISEYAKKCQEQTKLLLAKYPLTFK